MPILHWFKKKILNAIKLSNSHELSRIFCWLFESDVKSDNDVVLALFYCIIIVILDNFKIRKF